MYHLSEAADGELRRQRQDLCLVFKRSQEKLQKQRVTPERKDTVVMTCSWTENSHSCLNQTPIQILPSFEGHLSLDLCPTNTHSNEGELTHSSEFPMLRCGQRKMPDSSSVLDLLPQIISLRENQRFSLIGCLRICTLHSGLETTASLAPPWHCKISARVNTGKQPEMATNQNHKRPPASLTNLGFTPS